MDIALVEIRASGVEHLLVPFQTVDQNRQSLAPREIAEVIETCALRCSGYESLDRSHQRSPMQWFTTTRAAALAVCASEREGLEARTQRGIDVPDFHSERVVIRERDGSCVGVSAHHLQRALTGFEDPVVLQARDQDRQPLPP